MEPAHLDKKSNVDKMVRFITEASKANARLIVFPELIVTGYIGPYTAPERAGFYAASEPIPGPTTNRIQALAEKKGVYVVFGMAERGRATSAPSCTMWQSSPAPRAFSATTGKCTCPGKKSSIFFRGTT